MGQGWNLARMGQISYGLSLLIAVMLKYSHPWREVLLRMASAKMPVRVSLSPVLLAVSACFGLASLLFSPPASAQNGAAATDAALQARLQSDVNALTKFPSRAPGTPGQRAGGGLYAEPLRADFRRQ